MLKFGMALETFSRVAADWIRLRAFLYGVDDAQALMLRCYRRSTADKINERIVLAAWAEQDKAIVERLRDLHQ